MNPLALLYWIRIPFGTEDVPVKPGDRIVEVSGSRLQGEAAYQAMTGKGLYHVSIYGDDWGVVYGIV